MLITFEGLPGCGKKTQQRLLAKNIEQLGYNPVVMSREPGWNKDISGILRYMISEGNTNPIEKMFLFLADRAGHYEKFIRPILTQGAGLVRYPRTSEGHPNYHSTTQPIILCDGGPDSLLAYQGFGMNLAAIPFLHEANRLSMQGIIIDVTIFLDISIDRAVERMDAETKSRYSLRDKEYLHRVRHGYSEIMKREPQRILLIDGEGTEEIVAERVFNTVKSFLKTRSR